MHFIVTFIRALPVRFVIIYLHLHIKHMKVRIHQNHVILNNSMYINQQDEQNSYD